MIILANLTRKKSMYINSKSKQWYGSSGKVLRFLYCIAKKCTIQFSSRCEEGRQRASLGGDRETFEQRWKEIAKGKYVVKQLLIHFSLIYHYRLFRVCFDLCEGYGEVM